MCPIAASAASSNKSIDTRLPDRACMVSGVMNSFEDSVIATLISAPAFIKSLINSAHLYAAIPPVTPSSIRLLVRLNMESTENKGVKYCQLD
mgnify:FL=1